jgi:hypothetical protein
VVSVIFRDFDIVRKQAVTLEFHTDLLVLLLLAVMYNFCKPCVCVCVCIYICFCPFVTFLLLFMSFCYWLSTLMNNDLMN